MRRRISLVLLAALMTLPAVAPVRAAEPVSPEASVEPVGTQAPSTSPTPDSTPEVDPTVGASATAETSNVPETAAPSEAPDASTAPEPTPEPTPAASADPAPTTAPTSTVTPEPEPTKAPGRRAPSTDDGHGRPDVTDRYIVILDSRADTGDVVERVAKRTGVKADRTFNRAVRAFTARLTPAQRRTIEGDGSVVAVVPDEVIEVAAQTTPTGVSRIGTKRNTIAKINGIDERVNADVAIVDTGIQANHPDLNVVGGYNCSSSNRSAWRDVQGHGTHVAGTVAAIDNGAGVVGVAPGARLWAVKILNDDGYGLLSWYVCGLDWIASQRDPADSSRPLIEAVNMSVVKDGKDDRVCGTVNNDVLHKAICRVTAAGVTVVAAAGNDSRSAASRVPAAYNEVITVSALADLDGKAGAVGGPRCWSWGGYDSDETFADFSNFGSDVDIIAPGKCIWSSIPGSRYGYSSGTSMATPAVAGAVALYKASRPKATPAEVREALMYLANTGWKTSTDPDAYHEKLLDVSKLGSLGTFKLGAGPDGFVDETGGPTVVPVTVTRSSTFFERVRLTVSGVPAGWTASLDKASLLGWTATAATLTVTVPPSTPEGFYDITVTGTNQGRTASAVARVVVASDTPTAFPPSSAKAKTNAALGSTTASVVVAWPAATDPTSAITAYEFESRLDGGEWTATKTVPGSTRSVLTDLVVRGSYQFRVRARDAAGNWSDWAPTATFYRAVVYNDRNSSLQYAGTWAGSASASATSQTLKSSERNGANVRYTFTGRGISVIAPVSPTRGWFEVRIDGVFVGKVSLASSSLKHRQTVFSTAWETSGTHTIELRVVRSSLRPKASLDALVVLR